MKSILFVCLGNICRSPMAEYCMRDLVHQHHLEHEIRVASAATSSEEWGNPVYPPAREELLRHGIACNGHRATPMRRSDYDQYDLIIGMDSSNIRNILRICGGDPEGKVSLFLSHLPMGHPRFNQEVADPWYVGHFDQTWQEVSEGCRALLEELLPPTSTPATSPKKP